MDGTVRGLTGGVGESGVELGNDGKALLEANGDEDGSEGVEGTGDRRGVKVAMVMSKQVGNGGLDSLEERVRMRILPQLCLLLILFENLLGIPKFALMDPGIF